MSSFAEILLNWFTLHKRDLPWRKNRNPYQVWVSEVILQQTRVQQGLPYYLRFIQRFPSVDVLANASIHEVLKVWEGLGYYSRAHHLHQGAQYIQRVGMPQCYEEWLKVKGVGKYTAAAIASICYNEKVPVVDGNVYRVISRIFGLMEDIGHARSYKLFASFIKNLIPEHHAGSFNEALMELGATVCIPVKPHCSVCPFKSNCFAQHHSIIPFLPVKNKEKKITPETIRYLLMEEGPFIYLKKRDKKGIWKNLWELPVISGNPSGALTKIKEIKHTLTHKILTIEIFTSSHPILHKDIKKSSTKIPVKNLQNMAFPIPLRKFLNEYYCLSSSS